MGHFKPIIARRLQADMNRSVLLIPALCGKITDRVIKQALNPASQRDLEKGEQENISYTVQKKRHFFNKKESQKAGEVDVDIGSCSTA